MLVLKTFPHPLELRTKRTLLRAWKDGGLPAWCEMNADPEVRCHFASVPCCSATCCTGSTAPAAAAPFRKHRRDP